MRYAAFGLLGNVPDEFELCTAFSLSLPVCSPVSQPRTGGNTFSDNWLEPDSLELVAHEFYRRHLAVTLTQLANISYIICASAM